MRQLKLLADRQFWPLFWTQFLGAFNDSFLKNALVIWITYKGATFLGMGHQSMAVLSGAIFILPYFLFSGTAGQLADRYDKTSLARLIKVVEIVLMAIALVGLWLAWQGHEVGIGILLACVFGMGTHSTFFGPIKYSILPQLVGTEEARLVSANAVVEMGTNLAILFGMLLGTNLVLLDGGPLVVGGSLCAAAGLGWLASRFLPHVLPTDPDLKVEWNPVPPTARILAFVHPRRALWLSILGNSWFWLYGSVFLTLLPSYGKDTLQSEAHVVELFLTVFSIGVGLGSILCARYSFNRLELGLVPFGSIGMTLFAIDLFFAGAPTVGHMPPGQQLFTMEQFLAMPQTWRIVLDLFMLAVFAGLFIVPLYAILQQRAEPAHRARVIAANNIINSLFIVAESLVLIGLEKAGVSVPQIFLLLGVLNAIVAAYIYTLLPEFFLRFCIYLLAHLCYRLRSSGLENIPREGGAVLVCNHVTFIDWFLIAADIQRPIRFVMDVQFAEIKFLKAVFRDAKVIPIASARRNAEVKEAAFARIAQELDAGALVCIFPEGQLTPDGELGEFKNGILRIIERNPVPVIPMALGGLWGSFFSRKGGRALKNFRGFWHKVTLVVGKPVPPEEVDLETLRVRVLELARAAEEKLRQS